MSPTYQPAFEPHRRALGGPIGALRYAGVLAVWCGLFLIRPRLALDIFRHRRPDSPIPRLFARAA